MKDAKELQMLEILQLQFSKKAREGNTRRHTLSDLPRSSQVARSASSASHFPWATEKIRQDLYLNIVKEIDGIAILVFISGNRFRLIINDVECINRTKVGTDRNLDNIGKAESLKGISDFM